jgi:uncharacterized protein with HEPN domain
LRDYLEDLMVEINAVAQFTAEGEEAFYADERTQYAVMMAYARIGEIAKQIPNDVLARQSQVEWADVKGFRDVLLHRYFDVKLARVWEAVEKLPALRAAVAALIESLPSEDHEE